MKTIFSFLCAFIALGAVAQQTPNLLLTKADTVFLFGSSSTPVLYRQLSLDAYSISVNSETIGYRDENLVVDVTAEFVTLSTGDTIFANGVSITAAHELPEMVVTASSDEMLRFYEKPSLSLINQEEFPLGVIDGIYSDFATQDSVVVFTSQNNIAMLHLGFDTLSFIQGQAFESVWFTTVEAIDSMNVEDMLVDNPFELDTFLYSDPWFVHVTGEALSDQYTIFDPQEYLFSMDGPGGFQSNFFADLPGYPEVILDNQDISLASKIGIATHADLTIENTMGTAYLFSVNPDNGFAELQSVARSLDDNPSSSTEGGHHIKTLGFLDDGRLYRTRSWEPTQLLSSQTMEPNGTLPHYGTRQAETTGPQEEWVVSAEDFDAYSTEGDLYRMTAPSVVDSAGLTVISTISALDGFVFDGPNCALEPDQNYPPYTDITHQNGSDAASLDSSKIFLVNSNRNPRLDTIINGEVVPISFGLSFFVYDRITDTGVFLEDFSRDVNYVIESAGQHHPKFVYSEFQDSVVHMTLWNNNHDGCNNLPGEAVTLKIRWLGGSDFMLGDFKKLPIGSSYGLGSNYIREIDGEMIGLANTGGDASWSDDFNDRHASLYKTQGYMPTEIIGIVQLPKISLNTYHVDFHDIDLLPNVVTDISWSLNSDSSRVTLEVQSTPAGVWYWNGSDISTDSILSFPVDYILEKEAAWLYVSGNFPLDTMQGDWLNRVVSVDPLNLKDELSELLDIGVSVSDVTKPVDKVVLFPNPTTNGQFTLTRSGGKSLGEVRVVNIKGQEIYRSFIEKSAVFIDLQTGFTVAKTRLAPNSVIVLVQ